MIRVAAEQLPRELADLIDQVETGEVVLVERRGSVVATITRSAPGTAVFGASPEQDPVGALLRVREGVTLGGLSWKELRDEGRP